MTDKALKVCADYAHLSTEIKFRTKAIGDALSKCRGIKGERAEGYDFVEERVTYHDAEGGDTSHLKEAFAFEIDDSHPYVPERVYKDESEILEYLREACPYCLTAYEHVQARKTARKQFGIVKRAIGNIGRAENKRRRK